MKIETRKSLVGIAAVVGMALAFLLLYRTGERLGEDIPGPSKIARAPDGTIWVASHGQLHQFSATGERRRSVALSDLGRGSVISELLPLSDGTLVLAEAEPSAAYRCDVAALKCASITSGIAAAVGPLSHALMVAADEERRRFYVSDNAGHRLILLDFDGKVLDVSAQLRVLHPNELVLDAPGELVVVDTDHHRLLGVGVDRDVFGPDLWQMRTDRGLSLSRPGRILPMDLARSQEGGWWVLVARGGMKEGDVILFGSDGRAQKRLDLGEYSDPTQIAAVPGGLLVADPSNAVLARISGEGVAEPWGDAAFQSELESLRASRLRWRFARLAAQFMIFAFPLVGIFVLWRMGERLKPGPALTVPETPAPVGLETRWLEVLPEFKRRSRRLFMTTLMVIWLALAVMVWLWWPMDQTFRRIHLVFLFPMVVFAIVPLVPLIWAPKFWRMRLGTNGRVFFLDLGDGKVDEYAFDAIAVSEGKQLLAGRTLIPLHLGPGPVFAESELAGYILSRIPPSGRVSGFGLFVRSLRAGNRAIWFILVVSAIFAVLLLLYALDPAMSAYFK